MTTRLIQRAVAVLQSSAGAETVCKEKANFTGGEGMNAGRGKGGWWGGIGGNSSFIHSVLKRKKKEAQLCVWEAP